MRLSARIREDMVTGRSESDEAGHRHRIYVDPEVVARRMALDKEAELCPACCARPVRVRNSGLCTVCHLTHLSRGHHEVIAELEARRELNRVKQERKRLRDRVATEEIALGVQPPGIVAVDALPGGSP